MFSDVLGIDIALDKFDVCWVQDQRVLARKVFDNTPRGFQTFARWMRQHKIGKVALCMEATNIYWEALAQFSFSQQHPVYVINPHDAHHFIVSVNDQKRDPSDAERLAYFLLTPNRKLKPWTPPPPHRRQLRALVRRRDELVVMRQQESQRLATADQIVQPLLQRHLTFLASELAAVEAEMHDHIDHHPDLKEDVALVDSIKGIGFLSAAILVGELLDYTRFTCADALAAYAGLVPRERQSGNKRLPARLSKRGNALLRRALYFPAVVARSCNPIIAAQNARLHDRGRSKMQCIAAAMRKLLVLVFGVLKTRQPFRADFVHLAPAGA